MTTTTPGITAQDMVVGTFDLSRKGGLTALSLHR